MKRRRSRSSTLSSKKPKIEEQRRHENQSIPNSFEDHKNTWERSPYCVRDSGDDLVFQQMDIDYDMGEYIKGMPGNTIGKVPIMRLYGCTDQGNSVFLSVYGFVPYFLIESPFGFEESHCEEFRASLNKALPSLVRGNDKYENCVVKVEIVHKKSITGYANQIIPMIKIYLASPRLIPTARKLLEAGSISWKNKKLGMLTYESNLAFSLRYMVDQKMAGASWVKCKRGDYQIIPKEQQISRCQIEAVVAFDKLESLGTEEEWSKIAPLRVLSFDIECISEGMGFPDPQVPGDKIIQISNYVSVQGESDIFVKNIFNLKGCSMIVGAQVLCYNEERDLLRDWSRFIQILDPDIIIGYNISNFDFWYIISRMEKLGVSEALYLSRLKHEKSRINNETFSSKAYGIRESRNCAISGRVQLDILQAIQRDYKLRGYSLNAVSAHFLGKQKEDVEYNMIKVLFQGDDNDRKRIAVYCLRDSELPLLLMEKLMILVNYLEMARVTGVPVSYLLSRGQQIKVLSQIYRKALQKGLTIPCKRVIHDAGKGGVNYAGATVLSPLTGYYDLPISTLDFNSLYPTIMIAHNLCYTTLLRIEDLKNLNEEDYTKTPNGDYFIKSHVKKGVLPEILEELLNARKKAKRALAQEKDPFKAAVQNGRQLALKVSANSVYGFTGAVVGGLPCLQISAGVTAFGRSMIDLTKYLVEKTYTIKNGHAHDAVVIYGDTDSVMVKFGTKDVREAMRLGKEAAEMVTAHFVKPINLELEKVYLPYLLMSKKRYAGLLWMNPEKYDKMDAKGIVTVRRDNCRLVQEVIDTALRMILIDRNPRGAEEYVKGMISDLLQNKIDLSMLVITKALSKLEYSAKQAHVELAKRMAKRDPGTSPNIGDRVPYVMIKKSKNSRGFEKSEDPLFVLENNLPIDTEYYLENQLAKPLEAIFTPILGSVDKLLTGDHTRKRIVKEVSDLAPLSGFMIKKPRCANCRGDISQKEKPLCTHCTELGLESLVYQEKLAEMNELELKFSRLWTQCQSCQGSFHQPVLCKNRDCPIFYMRASARKNIQNAQELLCKFGN